MSLLKGERYTPSTERGVLYFNTVPRDMRPQEVRLHFSQYGDIRRMKFIPFPKKARRPGGALLPLQYKEGWMEFTSVEDAKHAAACKNGQPVDVKRQRRCYGQLWTVRFMEDFTWDSLLEEVEGKRRARRAAEVEARREERSMNEAYRRMVMRAQQRRKGKPRQREQQQVGGAHEGDDNNSSIAGKGEAAAGIEKQSKNVNVSMMMKGRLSERKSDLTAKKSVVKPVKKPKKLVVK